MRAWFFSRGSALAQVLVMGFILALIASYLMRWAHGRYMLVVRHQVATAASNQTEICIQEFQNARYAGLAAGAGVPGGVFVCANGVQITPVAQPGGVRLDVRAPVPVP